MQVAPRVAGSIGQRIAPGVGSAPANILELQGLSGNRSVQRLLAARQSAPAATETAPATTPGAPLLSTAQEARALSFYRSQPAKYTPAIVGQIQAAVGTAATGAMTAEDTQAVARKQAELNVDASPALAVDGMAGPRTLPTVFKVGIAQDVPLTDYTTKAAAMWKDKSATEEETAKALVETVMNPRLATLGIPPLTFVLTPALGSRGAFSAADWELKLDTEQFKPGPRHDLKQTTSTIYHECRHAEQHFKVAQMLAGKKQNAVQINQRSTIKLEVAQVAVDSPLAPGSMEAVIAEGWDESLNSAAGIEGRRRNNEELDIAFAAREKARADFAADPSETNAVKKAAAEERYRKAVAVHDDMPHEFDAERLEGRVDKEFEAAS